METEIHQQYRAIRRRIPEGTPITVLHIGEQETTVATGTGAVPEKVLTLVVGSLRTAAEFFLHTPPTPVELENAIMPVEDEITRAREMIAGYATLITTDECIREIAHIASGHAGASMQMSLDAVEQVFSLLAGYAQGRPAASAGIPGNTTFAATLLILREFMHHLKFPSISISE
jgi:exopolyphosphatase/pppGpp-phosphohydrolase